MSYIVRPVCGYRAGVEAHREAGESLCPACQRVTLRRLRIAQARRRSDSGDDVFSLDDTAGLRERFNSNFGSL